MSSTTVRGQRPDRTFARFVVALGLRALGPVLGALFLTISLSAAMFIASLPLGVLPCAEYQQRQLSTGSIGNVLTCAAVRIVSLWFLYRIGRGWLTLDNHQPMDQ